MRRGGDALAQARAEAERLLSERAGAGPVSPAPLPPGPAGQDIDGADGDG
jgi:hypothetical protein